MAPCWVQWEVADSLPVAVTSIDGDPGSLESQSRPATLAKETRD